MKTKFLLGFLLTAILLAMTVSAFSVSSDTIELSQTVKTINFSVTAGAAAVTVPDFPNIDDGFGNIIVVSTSDSVGDNGIVTAGTTETITVFYSSLPVKLAIGDLPVVKSNLTDGTDTKIVTLKFVSSFCDSGVKELYTVDSKTYELEFSISDINLVGFGDEKNNEWYPLDDLEIELDFDNVGVEDISDITVEMCLYDKSANKCVVDEGDMTLDDDFKLKDGDYKKLVVTYKVDPNSIDEAGSYVLYAKAYSDKLKEENLCLQDSESIEIMEDTFVLLDDVVIPDVVTCGETVEVKADVWNIGDDQENDVYLIAYNQELGINQKVIVGDIDNWDKQDVSFSFDIPKDAKEKTYFFELRVFDENDDLFETDNNDESKFNYNIKVEGNCAAVTEAETSASITAELDSDAIAGKQLAIKATIKNTGTEETTYALSAIGYSSWAELDSMDLKTATLKAGESKDFNIYLNVKEDAAGEQFFSILAEHDSATTKQEVSVVLEEAGAGAAGITGATITENIRANWFIWVIVIINIILIIAIIAVARRIAKSR